MMTLPAVDVLRPDTVAEAVAQLAAHPGARVLAGGTDIVPNLKYGMYDTQHPVALRGLSRELRYLRVGPHREIPPRAMWTLGELLRGAIGRGELPGPAGAVGA